MVLDTGGFALVDLHDARAADARLTGAKAANLATSARAGLPVLPGFVLVPRERVATAAAGTGAIRHAWRELSGNGARPLVVRSSSASEDTALSSMAGRFASVLDVTDWTAFREAVRTVVASAGPHGTREMAVLVQPMLRCRTGGVVFGADPVRGRTDRIVVSAVRGGPDALVSGAETGIRYRLTRRGRLLSSEPGEPVGRRVLEPRGLRRLARLARSTARLFGGPQDVEFGFDFEDGLWLFQSRPITAMAATPPRRARLLGPGPVAETFPGVLQPVEDDLWVVPMARGLAAALDLAGAAPRRSLRRHPLVTTVDGRVACDLRLLGAAPRPRRGLAVLNPAPGARRLGAAWRVGRLRVTLPDLAVDLMADVDRELARVGPLDGLSRAELRAALAWGRAVLVPLHAQESLASALLGEGTGRTAAAEALSVLAGTRRRGGDDADLVAQHPVLLALVPPGVGVPYRLPPAPAEAVSPCGVAALPVREGLRLRIRWVQELQARLLWELAARLERGGELGERHQITQLRWSELVTALHGGALPADLAERVPRRGSAPLPVAFRLADGLPVAVEERPSPAGGAGQGAGGGRVRGTSWHGVGIRPDDAVLVVRTLDPSLAASLPGLTALVAETGSVLSHLAVLAREYRVATVVGVPGALDRYPPGTTLTVDGRTGQVRAEPGPLPTSAPAPVTGEVTQAC
ncbi:hypothetical protein AQ490_15010 [Wenjunlia vitaminophila]|uniref:Pyruvate, water dikinase n=1 Tax=Wenjunlia vitaminophila TaxID=76728 RepID=A0A0T6LW81_WENVI|nr:PEP/pyruvate-binding domain-containing protein [Wenjunlia vitaminophila]KRV50403.1 hypothetical protein AQ490_15010 [Wenjunlia vitaminophila]